MHNPESIDNTTRPINDEFVRRVLLVYAGVMAALAFATLFGKYEVRTSTHIGLIVVLSIAVLSISVYAYLQRKDNPKYWLDYISLPGTQRLIMIVSVVFGSTVAFLILYSAWDGGRGEIALWKVASALGLGVFHVWMYNKALKKKPKLQNHKEGEDSDNVL